MPAPLPIPEYVREDWNEDVPIDTAWRNAKYSFCHRALSPKDKTKIPCGHIWEASLTERITGGGRCPICNTWRRRVTDVLRAEWREEFPILEALSNGRYKWQCSKCNHQFETTLINRILGSDCRKCSDKNSMIKLRRIQIPQCVIDDWAEPIPIESAHRRKRYNFVHRAADRLKQPPCGQRWVAYLHARISQETGCPHCNSRKPPAQRGAHG